MCVCNKVGLGKTCNLNMHKTYHDVKLQNNIKSRFPVGLERVNPEMFQIIKAFLVECRVDGGNS